MAAYFQTDSFRRLEKDWYQRLEASGFEDIEGPGERRLLTDWHSSRFMKLHDADKIEQTTAYHDEAQAFLHTHTFQSEFEREIWERHAQGESVRGIALALNTKASRVYTAIQRTRKLMKERYAEAV